MTHQSLEMIEVVLPGLKSVGMDMFFVGGSVVPLYVPEIKWGAIRPTMDVDVVIECVNYSAYSKLETMLEQSGFTHDVTDGSPICRWIYKNVIVDIMPEDSDVLGFTNVWYKEGRKTCVEYSLKSHNKIKILECSYFLATKISAFTSRGKNDFLGSSDIEDIICLIDGMNIDYAEKINLSINKVGQFLKENFKCLLINSKFLESIDGHIEPCTLHDDRVREVIKKITMITSGQK